MIHNPLYSEKIAPAYGALTAALNCLEDAQRDQPDDNLIDAICALREAASAVECWIAFCDEKRLGVTATSRSELIENLSLAMAAADGNEDAQQRALRSNHDALGYGGLAKAAVAELDRLGVLPGTSTANAATGAAEDPRADLVPVPGRGVTAT